MIICNKCGNTLQDTDVFCMHCGTKVERSAPAKPNKKICKNCNTEFDAVYDVCPSCGTIVPTVEQTSSVGTSGYAGAPSYLTPRTEDRNYPRLGGFLAVLTYGHLVGAIGLILGAIGSVVSLVLVAKLLKVYGGYYGGGSTASVIGPMVIQVLVYIYGAFSGFKVYQYIRDRDERILRFMEIWGIVNIGAFVLMAIFGGPLYLLFILGPIGCYVLYETYFRRSERVYKYFGSDEYIHWSIFGGSSNVSYSEKPKRPMESTKCVACGAYMTMYDEFCPNCGAARAKNASRYVNQKEVQKFCMYCGETLPHGSKVCTKCGKYN